MLVTVMVLEHLLSAQREGQKQLRKEGGQLRVFWKSLYETKNELSDITKFKTC